MDDYQDVDIPDYQSMKFTLQEFAAMLRSGTVKLYGGTLGDINKWRLFYRGNAKQVDG